MLKNQSSRTVILKWDSRNVSVPAGASVDIGQAFQIPPREVIPLEGFFLSKWPSELVRIENCVEQTPGVIPAAPVPGAVTENPFDEVPAAPGADKPAAPVEVKSLEEMTVDEIRDYLIENNELETWNGKTLKADLLKLAQGVRDGKKG